MVEFKNIKSNEGGLSVRTKLNEMLKGIIESGDGITGLWKFLRVLDNALKSLNLTLSDVSASLGEQILNCYDHTDTVFEDMRTYVNGISGGISGFAVDISFMPDFPVDKAATVLAVGAGVYENMLDINGDPIEIKDVDALVIFYKGAGVTYWQYKCVFARVVLDANIDGGTASTRWGGSKNIDGGTAAGGGDVTEIS